MTENKNTPAFPAVNNDTAFYVPGLSKRECFAMAAMQGLMAVNDKGPFDSVEACIAEAARLSVIAADALLNELSKS